MGARADSIEFSSDSCAGVREKMALLLQEAMVARERIDRVRMMKVDVVRRD